MEVLAMPDRISKDVLDRGLDANTAFEIVSIDIADINVGENIGARLQTDQAEADMRMAYARAEVRRAEAIAWQQEMKAKVAESRAMLVLAEAEIPAAVAVAFRAGQLHMGRSMKVLLVYPPTPDTFWSFKHVLRFVSKRAAFPPLGLLTVAGMLPADWQVKLVDMNVIG
jgi:uncharacterized protein YqfA (UPF0365 family)